MLPSLILAQAGLDWVKVETIEGPAAITGEGVTVPVQPAAVVKLIVYVPGARPVKVPVVLLIFPGFNVYVVPAPVGAVTVIVPLFTVGQVVFTTLALPLMAGPAATTGAGDTLPVQPEAVTKLIV